MRSYREAYYNEVKKRVASEQESVRLRTAMEMWVGFARIQKQADFIEYVAHFYGVSLGSRKMLLADVMKETTGD